MKKELLFKLLAVVVIIAGGLFYGASQQPDWFLYRLPPILTSVIAITIIVVGVQLWRHSKNLDGYMDEIGE